MTDKLTFSFNGPVTVRIGGQDVDLSAKTDALNYAGRNKNGPLVGFKADDGTFFRLKDKGGGQVDVIVYGEPEKLANYQFKVQSGDLTKARFADGGDFRRTAQSARNFTLDGKALTGSARDAFLRDNAFVAKDAPLNPPPKAPSQPAATPGAPPSSSAPAKSASPVALKHLAKGVRSDDDLEALLSQYHDNTQGVSAGQQTLIRQILDNLRAERRANQRHQADQQQEQVRQDRQHADVRQADLDEDSQGPFADQNAPVFEVSQLRGTATDKASQSAAQLHARLEIIKQDDSELFAALQSDYPTDAQHPQAHTPFTLAQAMMASHGRATVALTIIDDQESARARSAAAEIAQSENQTNAIAGKLQTLNLKTRSIPDDGHCLYAAIAHAAGLGGQDADAQPAMALRERLLNRALSLTDQQLAELTRKDNGSPLSQQPTVSFLTEAVKEIGRGLNVRSPSQQGWGTFHSLHLAAIELQRPIIAIGHNDQANLYKPDGSSEALQGNWVELAQSTSADGAGPLIIPQASATHWVSTEPLS